MRLPGTERWSDEDVEAVLALADNLRVATISVVLTVLERDLPGGAIATDAWQPTDLVHKLADAAGLAFATGRLSEGLRIASSAAQIGGPPPRMTLMQTILAGTLGAIAGTLAVTLFEDEVTIEVSEPRGFATFDLANHGMVQRQRLAELVVPAAFASPTFLDEIHGRASGDFAERRDGPTLDDFARLSPTVRFARDWKREGEMNQILLSGSLFDYEARIGHLRTDREAWLESPFRDPLIDWPLLATLVGLHRWQETPRDGDLAVGPATRFLHDLARGIVAATPRARDAGAPA